MKCSLNHIYLPPSREHSLLMVVMINNHNQLNARGPPQDCATLSSGAPHAEMRLSHIISLLYSHSISALAVSCSAQAPPPHTIYTQPSCRPAKPCARHSVSAAFDVRFPRARARSLSSRSISTRLCAARVGVFIIFHSISIHIALVVAPTTHIYNRAARATALFVARFGGSLNLI